MTIRTGRIIRRSRSRFRIPGPHDANCVIPRPISIRRSTASTRVADLMLPQTLVPRSVLLRPPTQHRAGSGAGCRPPPVAGPALGRARGGSRPGKTRVASSIRLSGIQACTVVISIVNILEALRRYCQFGVRRVVHAAALLSSMSSMPSLNRTPSMTLASWRKPRFQEARSVTPVSVPSDRLPPIRPDETVRPPSVSSRMPCSE